MREDSSGQVKQRTGQAAERSAASGGLPRACGRLPLQSLRLRPPHSPPCAGRHQGLLNQVQITGNESSGFVGRRSLAGRQGKMDAPHHSPTGAHPGECGVDDSEPATRLAEGEAVVGDGLNDPDGEAACLPARSVPMRAAMPAGASSPRALAYTSADAFRTYPHGAAQPVWEDVSRCVRVQVASLNLGMPQSMLMSSKLWNSLHREKFFDVLESLGPCVGSDMVLCSEVGDARMGFGMATTGVDYRPVVQQAMPGAASACSGAYVHVWNIRNQAAAVVKTGTWRVATCVAGDMHWQAFDLTYREFTRADRDAPQLADPKVGLLVGNLHIPSLHIPSGGLQPLNEATRRKIVEQALLQLTRHNVAKWKGRKDFPVVRLLVGDCSLEKHAAEAVAQKMTSWRFYDPPLTPLQRDFDVCQWQVRDVQFPRPALESARSRHAGHTTAPLSRGLCRQHGTHSVCVSLRIKYSDCSPLRATPNASLGTMHHDNRCSPRALRSAAT